VGLAPVIGPIQPTPTTEEVAEERGQQQGEGKGDDTDEGYGEHREYSEVRRCDGDFGPLAGARGSVWFGG
jgi:hypothetical protein